MPAEIHRLHPIPPIGHYLRLGHTGHRQLENLYASGRPAPRSSWMHAWPSYQRPVVMDRVFELSGAPFPRAGRNRAVVAN